MWIFLVFGAIGSAFYGFSIWGKAESVMHQIAAIGYFTVASVLITGAFIVLAIEMLPKRNAKAMALYAPSPRMPPPPPAAPVE